MKLKLCTALLTAATILAPLSALAEKAQDPAAAKRTAVAMYGKLPLSFEPTESPARFLARSGNYSVSVGGHESSVAVTDAKSGKHSMLRFAFENANPAAPLQALEPLPGVTNYYLGQDASKWRLGVKSYGKLRAQGVYPGVDVVYYGDHRRLEFDFVIAPKADPAAIALSLSGMDKLYKDTDGDLVAEIGGQPVHFAKPYAYQKVGSGSKAVAADYELAADGKVRLHLGDYDHNAELIVDPVVSYLTYLGGSLGDVGNGIAVDSFGSIYVTGQTCSSNFPNSPNPSGLLFVPTSACDAYVVKYTADGTGYVYTAILGGTTPANATAAAYGIALDASNQAYIIGTTNIENLPGTPVATSPLTSPNSYQGGDSDAFIVILDASGNFVRSSYLGGSGADLGYAIAVDTATPANVTVIGQTCSQDFPGYSAFETKVEACVAFITKLDNNLDIASKLYSGLTTGRINPAASALTPAPASGGGKTYYFSEFYGGQPVAPYPTAGWQQFTTYPQGAIVYDNEAPPHVQVALNAGTAGPYEPAPALPVLPPWNSTLLGQTPDGTIVWEDLGPAAIPTVAFTEGYGVAIDPPGDVFLSGGTDTASLASAIWPCHPGGTGAWVLKIYGTGNSAHFLSSASFNGGGCAYAWSLESTATDVTGTIDTARAIAVDSEGRAYVTGTASGSLGTTQNAYQPGNAGGPDAFLARINIAGSAIDYATYLGGSGKDQGLGVAVDKNFSPYVAGATKSMNFPTINPLNDPNNGDQIQLSGTENAFVTKFTPDGTALIFSAYLGGSDADQVNAIAVGTDLTDPSFTDIYLAGNTTSPDLVTTLDCLMATPQPCNPIYTPPQANNEGNGDAFVAMIPGASIPLVTVTPGSLAFGSLNVGTTSAAQVITYTNTNSLSTVQINSITFSAPQFQQAAGNGATPDCSPQSLIPPTKSCQVLVIFTPSAQTLQTGTLSITDDATSAPHVVNLSGEGAVPTDSFTPASLNFNKVTVNTTSASQSVTLSNTGANGILFVKSIVIAGINPGDFSETDNCSTPIPPSPTVPYSNCKIDVTFTPGAAGLRSGTVTITDNAPGSPHVIPISGTGTLVVGTVSPISLTFPQQAPNQASPASTACVSGVPGSCYITVKNTDPSQNLVVTGIATTGDYQASTSNCNTPLAPSASCTIQVVFFPIGQGTHTGTLTISGNGTINSAAMPTTIALSGSAGANATFGPNLTFAAPNNVGTTSAAQVVTLVNQSTFAFNIQGIAISGAAAGDFSQTNTCGTSVFASSSCAISVSFTPTTTGNRNATLTVTSDAAASPQSVSLVGVGTAPAVTLVPAMNSTVNFGNQPLTAASNARSIALTNTGTGPLNIPAGGITITGTAAGDFSQSNTCGTQVAAGASCTISVIFTPSALNSRSATLNIADDAIPNPQTLALSGTGVQVAAPTITPSLTFTNQPLTQSSTARTVTIKNTDPVYPLTFGAIAASGDFQVVAQPGSCGTTLAAGASCGINVTFTPTASGTRTGTLTVASNGSTTPLSVTLTGTGGAVASVSPISLNLGSTNVGASSPALSVTLSNTSAFPVNITGTPTLSGTGAVEFNAVNNCGTIVPAASGSTPGTCTMSVTFTPSATGIQTATLTISSDAATPFTPIALTGTGTAPTVMLTPVTSSTVNFGNQPVNGASSPILVPATCGTPAAAGASSCAILLTNSGTGPLNIQAGGITITGTASADFSQTNTCGTQVTAGASCSIIVTFTPSQLYNRSATLTITDNATPSTQTIALLGTGKQVNAPTVTPALLIVTFPGTQPLNVASAAQTVTVTNTDPTYPLTVLAVSISGDFQMQTGGCVKTATATTAVTVPAGGSCAINVTFTPTATGVESGTLSIVTNGQTAPVVLTLTGTGGAPASGTITLTANSLTFNNEQVGVTSPVQTVKLTNTGAGPLNFPTGGGIAITGSSFAIDTATTTCPTTAAGVLAINGSCIVGVSFTPSVTGAATGTVTITSSATNSTLQIALSGTGISAVPSGTILLNPVSGSTLSFGNEQQGESSPIQSVTLKNTDTGPLSIPAGGIAITGTNAADFSIVPNGTNSCGTAAVTLTAGQSCSIAVIFTPSGAGNETATLKVTGSASLNQPQSVTLKGIVAPFVVTSQSSGVSVTQGGTAVYPLSVAPLNGFNGKITFSCTVSGPASFPCSFSSNPVQMDGSTTQITNLSVNTTGSSAKARVGGRSIFLALLPFSMMGMLLINKRRGGWLVLVLLALCLLLGLASCGSGSSSTKSGAVPTGTYTVTVAATWQGSTQPESVTLGDLSLVVNHQ